MPKLLDPGGGGPKSIVSAGLQGGNGFCIFLAFLVLAKTKLNFCLYLGATSANVKAKHSVGFILKVFSCNMRIYKVIFFGSCFPPPGKSSG